MLDAVVNALLTLTLTLSLSLSLSLSLTLTLTSPEELLQRIHDMLTAHSGGSSRALDFILYLVKHWEDEDYCGKDPQRVLNLRIPVVQTQLGPACINDCYLSRTPFDLPVVEPAWVECASYMGVANHPSMDILTRALEKTAFCSHQIAQERFVYMSDRIGDLTSSQQARIKTMEIVPANNQLYPPSVLHLLSPTTSFSRLVPCVQFCSKANTFLEHVGASTAQPSPLVCAEALLKNPQSAREILETCGRHAYLELLLHICKTEMPSGIICEWQQQSLLLADGTNLKLYSPEEVYIPDSDCFKHMFNPILGPGPPELPADDARILSDLYITLGSMRLSKAVKQEMCHCASMTSSEQTSRLSSLIRARCHLLLWHIDVKPNAHDLLRNIIVKEAPTVNVQYTFGMQKCIRAAKAYSYITAEGTMELVL